MAEPSGRDLAALLQRGAPYLAVVSAAAAVGATLVVKEVRAALWLDRFHDLAALVYAVLFGLVIVAATMVVHHDGAPPLRAALRGALTWGGVATLYTLLAAALDLPTGEGSVAVLAGVSAGVGVLAATSFARTVLALHAALGDDSG